MRRITPLIFAIVFCLCCLPFLSGCRIVSPNSSSGNGFSDQSGSYDYGYNASLSSDEAQMVRESIDLVRYAYADFGVECKHMNLGMVSISYVPQADRALGDNFGSSITLYAVHGGVNSAVAVHEFVHYQTSAFAIWNWFFGADFWTEMLTEKVSSYISNREPICYKECFALYDAMMEAMRSKGYNTNQVEDDILRYFFNNDRNGLASYINGIFGANVYNIGIGHLGEAAAQMANAAYQQGMDPSALENYAQSYR